MSNIKRLMFVIIGFVVVHGCYAKEKDFHVTIANNVIVRSKPDINSSDIITIPIGQLLKVVSNLNVKSISNGLKSNWLFIDTGFYNDDDDGSDTLKGWVLSTNIAHRKDFKTVRGFGVYKMEGMLGDYAIDIKFNSNGVFEQMLYDNTGKFNKMVKGQFYKCGNLIYINGTYMGNRDYIEMFYLDNNMNLFTVEIDASGKPIQAKRLDN